MAEREPSPSIGEDGALVGTTMAQCVGHCLGHGGNRRGRALPPSIPNAGDATHLSGSGALGPRVRIARACTGRPPRADAAPRTAYTGRIRLAGLLYLAGDAV